MPPKLTNLVSFRHKLAEKRERFLSVKGGYSELGFVPGGLEDGEVSRHGCCSFRAISDGIVSFCKTVQNVAFLGWQMGAKDPRKFIFAAKMGLALALTSFLIFWKQPFSHMSRYSVWAILTVVVVFEFSIGATLSKGFNRGLGTLSAGGLALAMSELAKLCGKWQEVVVIINIFTVGFCASYIKVYPTMKAYEYGFRVFLITYCMVTGSGYRTGEFVATAVNRFVFIAVGAGVAFGVNVLIYPIWAGEDLHNLVTRNFMGVATSLEGVIKSYLNCVEYERVPSKILTYQALDDPVYTGYRAAVESTSQEEALVGFAVWEPPHGPYEMIKHPWKDYVRVSGALRHCAFMVMAMHGCILSEIQAPEEKRHIFRSELQRVGSAGAKVLRELGNKIKKMEKLGQTDILFEVHEAAEELQEKIDKKSYIFVHSENWEIGNRPKRLDDPQDLLDMEEGRKFLQHKSLSEAVLDLRSVPLPTGWESSVTVTANASPAMPAAMTESMFRKHVSWLDNKSFRKDKTPELDESKTYESATAMSLALFTSLLIEFVARLQNLVNAFEILSETARFKEPFECQEPAVSDGFWTRVGKCLKLR